ncbi:hypothetical protein HALLA_10410 [Halostagnicola larsenii XH-48]|uniref:DUF4367 domain-containing protein n=1 Tax=Halostagnicola larsenii XH-48 TaxID=797299 RepID=W0JV14_9EURY|nr:DUF4367 domain-containing protein [Halostagnicola larsenii]AHG00873.1 hypothetical protein HALLA_10410 [Halostagnicola larsenii XH-48]
MSRLVSPLVLIAVVLVVLTAGCAGLVGENDVPGEQLSQELNTTEPPETLFATVETTTTTTDSNGSETESLTETVWLRDDGTSRTEAGENHSSEEDGGYIVVNDGEQVWYQDTESGSVTSYETQTNDSSRLERIYAEQERYFDRFEVRSVNETTIDGRQAHRVVFEPPRNETVDRSIDIMIEETTYRIPLETSLENVSGDQPDEIVIAFDAETMFPLQYEMASPSAEFSVTYENVSFNDPLDDELFEFEPPADSEPDDIVLPETADYDSVDDADAAVNFSVSTPDNDTIPSGFELESVSGTTYPDEDRTQVTQSYRDDDDRSIRVAIGDGPRSIPVEGSSVSVDGVDGTIAETEQGTELEWERDEHYYHLFADEDLSEETVLEIAESLHT